MQAPDFSDASLEWRRIFSELWGTFLLVVVAAGGKLIHELSHGAVGNAEAVVAPGLMVMVVIYSMGAVGGAHINPAVTFAFALRGNFPWYRVPGYVLAQFAGALLACLFLVLMFGGGTKLGATTPGPGISHPQAFAMEVMLSTGLVGTILATASGARNIGANGAIAVGSYIALAGLWSHPISGASMNPARSLAPDIVRGDFVATPIYIVAPLIGAVIGVGFEWILKGRPTVEGTKTAQGEVGGEGAAGLPKESKNS